MLFKFMAAAAGGSFGVQLSCTMLAAPPQQMILDLLQSLFPVISDDFLHPGVFFRDVS